MSIAYQHPADLGLPFSRWSLNSLRDEIIKQGVVDDISRSRLAVLLNDGEIGLDRHCDQARHPEELATKDLHDNMEGDSLLRPERHGRNGGQGREIKLHKT